MYKRKGLSQLTLLKVSLLWTLGRQYIKAVCQPVAEQIQSPHGREAKDREDETECHSPLEGHAPAT